MESHTLRDDFSGSLSELLRARRGDGTRVVGRHAPPSAARASAARLHALLEQVRWTPQQMHVLGGAAATGFASPAIGQLGGAAKTHTKGAEADLLRSAVRDLCRRGRRRVVLAPSLRRPLRGRGGLFLCEVTETE